MTMQHDPARGRIAECLDAIMEGSAMIAGEADYVGAERGLAIGSFELGMIFALGHPEDAARILGEVRLHRGNLTRWYSAAAGYIHDGGRPPGRFT